MNIDFHFAVTFISARCAGFEAQEAEVIAHAAQYVDDATNDGLVRFDNGALYSRATTAHRMLDYKNFAELSGQRVWIPFHFLPSGTNASDHFIDKLLTRPNSEVAQAMVRASIADAERPYGLHRLGITAHVFVDTWAHQGFAGVNHAINQVHEVRREGRVDPRFHDKLSRFFNGFVQQRLPPLGHGAALSYPDRPYLRWSYTNGRGEEVHRDNPRDFTEAADELCRLFRRYRLRDPFADVEGLPTRTRATIAKLFETLVQPDEQERLGRWLAALRDDLFHVGAANLHYTDKGAGSWKHAALGTLEANDPAGKLFPYSTRFLSSDWKRFHDAAKAHRRALVDDVLPEFGIVVA